MKNDTKSKGRLAQTYDRLSKRAMALWAYCSEGVWEDHRDNLKVNLIKTVNLTVKPL